MTVADEEFARELARLSATFVADLPRKVQSLSDDLAALLSAPREAALLDKLSHNVHQLKGAGSTFGYRSISDAARVLEQRLAELPAGETTRLSAAVGEVEAAMEALRGEANRVHGESAEDGVET